MPSKNSFQKHKSLVMLTRNLIQNQLTDRYSRSIIRAIQSPGSSSRIGHWKRLPPNVVKLKIKNTKPTIMLPGLR